VTGKIIKVHHEDFTYKGHRHRASKDDPQYEITRVIRRITLRPTREARSRRLSNGGRIHNHRSFQP
jgi:hypothetical protein